MATAIKAAAGTDFKVEATRSFPQEPTYVSGTTQIFVGADATVKDSVAIFTDRLKIASIHPTDKDDPIYDFYATMYGDKEVMSTLADGKPKTADYVRDRIDNTWAKRWRNGDVFSGYCVTDKITGKFLGHISLAHGDHPGESELSGLGMTDFWAKGYGTEAATAIVRHWAPLTVRLGYELDGKPLSRIVATARADNLGSVKILEFKLGMLWMMTGEKYGATRHTYQLDLPSQKKWCCTRLFERLIKMLNG